MPEEHIYKSNFIKKVIFRVDFDDLPAINEGLDTRFIEEMNKSYPLLESKKLFRTEIKLDAKEGQETPNTTHANLWIFSDSNGAELANFHRNFFSVETTAYVRFSEFLERAKIAFNLFQNKFQIEHVKRIGLRFINEISINNGGSALEWSKYLNENLIAPLKFFEVPDGKLAKELVQLAINKEDCTISVVAGAWNSEFPNPIVKKEFVLDLDCYTTLITESNQVLDKAQKFNKYLHDIFEKAIKQPFRDLLNQ